MEAGDCEGRLPPLFCQALFPRCQISDVRMTVYRHLTSNIRHPPCMNIGITVYPTYGGSGIVGSELGKELAPRGHTVHFISSSLPTRLTELKQPVRFHEVQMMSYPR